MAEGLLRMSYVSTCLPGHPHASVIARQTAPIQPDNLSQRYYPRTGPRQLPPRHSMVAQGLQGAPKGQGRLKTPQLCGLLRPRGMSYFHDVDREAAAFCYPKITKTVASSDNSHSAHPGVVPNHPPAATAASDTLGKILSSFGRGARNYSLANPTGAAPTPEKKKIPPTNPNPLRYHHRHPGGAYE